MRERALRIAVIVVGLLLCGAGSAGSPTQKGKGTTLTNLRPTANLPIPPGVLRTTPPILEVPLTSVHNEKRTPFAIFVYLVWKEGQTGSRKQRRVLVGNFAVFPPDHPGRYILRVSKAFGELLRQGKDPVQLRPALQFELRRVHEKRPWTPIETAIGPVRWLREDEVGKGSP